MYRQVSLRRRWAETAGWLGVRVRHSAGQEGPEGESAVRRDSPSSGLGLCSSLFLGAAALLGVKWVVLKWYQGHRVCNHHSLNLLPALQSPSHPPST